MQTAGLACRSNVGDHLHWRQLGQGLAYGAFLREEGREVVPRKAQPVRPHLVPYRSVARLNSC